MAEIKSTDLRSKTPLERAIKIIAVQREMRKLGSQEKVAESLQINRRTVAKYLIAPAPTIIHSVLSNLIDTILLRIDRCGIDQAQIELGYNWRMSEDYKFRIAKAKAMLQRGVDVSSFLNEASGPPTSYKCKLEDRWTGEQLTRLVKNKDPIRILFQGVLLQTDDFLADNIVFFKKLAITHPQLKPKQLQREANFCLLFMFGNRFHEWAARVDRNKLRWHMHKARQEHK